jgi:LPS-assembly protein
LPIQTRRRTPRSVPGAALLAALASASSAWAQAPAPAAAPPPAPERVCNPADEICVTAQDLERLSAERTRWAGFVDLRFGDSRIQAEQLELVQTKNADGSVSQRIEAVGNVVFLRGDERMAGERLTMDLGTGRGTFDNAIGFMTPGVFVEARQVERVDADTFKIHGGKFTSCSQTTPRWSFKASSATLDVDKRITATNVVFKVKAVPALYIPWFTYPIEQDQRSSGFLIPHIGRSSVKGRQIGTGFFWAMNRSFDQTFYLDNYSEYGWGFGHEFRYALRSPSRATFRTYLFRRTFDVPQAVWEHDFNWTAVQLLPGRVKASLRVRESSTIDFREQFQDDPDQALYRTRSSSGSLQRSFGPANVLLMGDSQDTFFGDNETFERRRLLPSLQIGFSPRKHKATGLVFGLDAKGENITNGNQDQVDTYGRYDFFPRLSRPFSISFLQVTPTVAYRGTRYGVTDLDLDPSSTDLSGDPVNRKYLEGNVNVVGPTFSRVFDTPGNFYSEKYKHVIGPEVTWTYRSKVEPLLFESIPFFDQDDRVPGTNQLSYALVQRVYAKRVTTPGGKAETYEFLNFRIGQTYYVQTAASQFDPTYSSSFFGPGGTPSHYSPVKARLRFRPSPRFTNDFNAEYDVNFHKVKSLNIALGTQLDRLRLDASWYRGNRFRGTSLDQSTIRAQDTIRGAAWLALLPNKLSASGTSTYDLIEDRLVESSARLRYDVQCCGFSVSMSRINYSVPETRWSFSVDLANIGSIGNFLGTEGYAGGLYGGR